MSQNILQLTPPPPGRRIPYGTDPNQFGELRMPEAAGPHPVVIFIHGGYWRAAYDLTHAGHLCVALVNAGYAVWSLEYRRTGQPGGGYPGTLDDIRAGALRLRTIDGVDLNRVVVAGHSAGGHLALWLAAQKVIDLKTVIALAAVSDLRVGHQLKLGGGAVEAFMGCAPAACAASYSAASPVELLPINIPQILLHGSSDDIVPLSLSQSFARASKNARLVELPDAGHFELIDPRSKEWTVVMRNITAPLAA